MRCTCLQVLYRKCQPEIPVCHDRHVGLFMTVLRKKHCISNAMNLKSPILGNGLSCVARFFFNLFHGHLIPLFLTAYAMLAIHSQYASPSMV